MVYNLDQRNEIYTLRNKIAHDQASSAEMNKYLNLLLKSSDYNRNVVEDYVHEIGYSSIEDFQSHLNEKNNKEITNGLLLIGGAILLAYLFDKMFE